eukprot:c21770_g1_i1 orf=217-1725(+)
MGENRNVKEKEQMRSVFNPISEDILVNIFSRLEEDPCDLARLACVCSQFTKVIKSTCWRLKCMRILPSLVADLLQPMGKACKVGEPPGGWGALQKLLVCCPGLFHAGVLLENWDFGLEREVGPSEWCRVVRSPLRNSEEEDFTVGSDNVLMGTATGDGRLASLLKNCRVNSGPLGEGEIEHLQGSKCEGELSEKRMDESKLLESALLLDSIGRQFIYTTPEVSHGMDRHPVSDGDPCDVALRDSYKSFEDYKKPDLYADGKFTAVNAPCTDRVCVSKKIKYDDSKTEKPLKLAAEAGVPKLSWFEEGRLHDRIEFQGDSGIPHDKGLQIERESSNNGHSEEGSLEIHLTERSSKRRKRSLHMDPHLANGSWNFSREQGNKLLANRFRADSLYICDWPGCVHPCEKRKYKLFRGVFKNFKNSHVWRNLKDMRGRKTNFHCVFCSCDSTWDMVTTFCLKRPMEYHDDGEPVVRAYVCDNGHVAGAWTDRPLYNLHESVCDSFFL